MRQTLKDRRIQLHRGMPMPRLLTMVLMAAIMALIFVRLRDPNTLRFFAQVADDEDRVLAANEKAVGSAKPAAADSGTTLTTTGQQPVPAAARVAESSPPKDSSTAAVEMTPTGPTDLDPIEQDDIKQAISVISDGNLEMTNLDMPAYFQILSWVDHQSTPLLRKRAKRDVLYSDFRKTPDSMRLQIVELKLSVRQIIRLTMPPKNGITEPMTTREGQAIYEVRGFTQEGGSNLYFGIVTNLPKGMPIGASINEDAKLVGYFFKLQGYISLQQQLEAERTRRKPVTLKAPVIIGRLIWTAAPSVADEKPPIWILATIGTVGVAIIVGWVLLAMRKSGRRSLPPMLPGPNPDPEAPSVDNWLDQAQSGRLTLEPVSETDARSEGTSLDSAFPDGAALDGGFGGRFSGNIFGGNGDSNNGHGNLGPEIHDNGNPSGG